MARPAGETGRPLRLLVVLPSWLGDAVMATPALRRLRDGLPGAFIGGLVRPGVDQVVAGLPLLDEVHVERPTGVLGPKRTAARVRPRRYDTALLLTNSFSTALIARVAGIPRRVGYDRDGRGVLLNRRLRAPRRPGGGWAVVPAAGYYWFAAGALLDPAHPRELTAPALTSATHAETGLPADARLELAATDAERERAAAVLDRCDLREGEAYAVLNPGGNNPAKRWPAERFAELADTLAREHGLRVLLNGAPGEHDLLASIAERCGTGTRPALLPGAGNTVGSLKAVVAGASLLVTNDTGPRHIGVAFGTPTVTLFGPTDPRWTTVPCERSAAGVAAETVLVADPALPPTELSNDHPERCRIDRIELAAVIAACAALLEAFPIAGRPDRLRRPGG